MSGEMLYESFLRQETGLGETIHAFADLHHDVVIVDERQEVVLGDDGGRNDGDRDTHILIAFEGGV